MGSIRVCFGSAAWAWMVMGSFCAAGTREAGRPEKSVEVGADRGMTGFENRLTVLDRSHPVERIVLTLDGDVLAEKAGGFVPGRVIYRNEGGSLVFNPGRDFLIGDDLLSLSIDGCRLTAYSLMVGGGGDGSGAGFEVETALYEACPPSGASEFPRTRRRVMLPHDGLFEIVIEIEPTSVFIAPRTWLGVRFSTDSAGWVVGVPSVTGFSQDAFSYPGVGCGSFFGGYPRRPHGSFAVTLWAEESCEVQHHAYVASRFAPMPRPAGPHVLAADDVHLSVDDCELASYEVGIRGTAGSYVMDLELRYDGPGDPVPGTKRRFEGTGNGTTESARFTFEPGIHLPGRVWMTWHTLRPNTGVGVAGGSQVGWSDDLYAVLDFGTQPASWSFRNFVGNPSAVFQVTIGCRGEPPTGACCVAEVSGGAGRCEEGVEEVSCPGRWLRDVSCDEALFDPPCEAAACCDGAGICVDRTVDECRAVAGVWLSDRRCEDDDACPPAACLTAIGDCFLVTPPLVCPSDAGCPAGSHCAGGFCGPGAGCCRLDCCAAVCREDGYCCAAAWDSLCADRASTVCVPPAGHEECASASGGAFDIPLNEEGSGTVEGDTRNSCGESEAFVPCCPEFRSASGGGLWFRFVAAAPTGRVHTCGSDDPLGAKDSVLTVFRSRTGGCDGLEVVGCSDDGCGPGGRMSLVSFGDLEVGETYYVLLTAMDTTADGVYRVQVESSGVQIRGGDDGVTGNPGIADSFGSKTSILGPAVLCPDGTIAWIDPPDGVIDGRAAHHPSSPGQLLTIDRLTIRGFAGVEQPDCWSVCTGGTGGYANRVKSGLVNSDGSVTLMLEAAIRPGAETLVRYRSDTGCTDRTLRVKSLPGDVNADGLTSSADVSSFIDRCVTGLGPAPFDPYSCDLDHSGVMGPVDLSRLIDLLNGVGDSPGWIGVRLASVESCP